MYHQKCLVRNIHYPESTKPWENLWRKSVNSTKLLRSQENGINIDNFRNNANDNYDWRNVTISTKSCKTDMTRKTLNHSETILKRKNTREPWSVRHRWIKTREFNHWLQRVIQHPRESVSIRVHYHQFTQINQFPSAPAIEITSARVGKLLKNLKTAKASGPDNIPNIILNTCADELSVGLAVIFQRSLDTWSIPLDWQNAIIAPVFKKGDRHLASNYRSVSLTSVISKTIKHHFEKHNIPTNLNHGFKSGF